MSVWDELVGQTEQIARLRRLADAHAARAAGPSLFDGVVHDDDPAMSADLAPGADLRLAHSWLFTGPAGSGRSNLALAFAAALLCPVGGCGVCSSCVMARTGSHPDLRVFRTEKVMIGIDDVREIVAASYMSPSISSVRIQLIEDADRMTERTSNVLLKAIEEPPESTMWILCSPSEADMLPTIRSRVHTVRLSTPTVDQVADFLVAADGVDPALARRCARESQCHIGMARRLATDEQARSRREASIDVFLGILSPSFLAKGAADLVALATEDSSSADGVRLERERGEFLRQLGLPPGEPVPAQYRSQVRAFDEDSKRRTKRSLRDGVDRLLLDFESVGRDALILSLGARGELINVERAVQIGQWVARRSPADVVAALDAIATARVRLAANVQPILALEGLLVSVVDRDARV